MKKRQKVRKVCRGCERLRRENYLLRLQIKRVKERIRSGYKGYISHLKRVKERIRSGYKGYISHLKKEYEDIIKKQRLVVEGLEYKNEELENKIKTLGQIERIPVTPITPGGVSGIQRVLILEFSLPPNYIQDIISIENLPSEYYDYKQGTGMYMDLFSFLYNELSLLIDYFKILKIEVAVDMEIRQLGLPLDISDDYIFLKIVSVIQKILLYYNPEKAVKVRIYHIVGIESLSIEG